VFLGGAVSDPEIFSVCWRALPVGGRLVANSVTLEGEAAVIERHKRWGGDLVRMDVSRVTEVGRLRGLRPSMSVLQWRVTKGEES
jgi:precorrin-6Y C5,15-methyltransferase (decarboxylating)